MRLGKLTLDFGGIQTDCFREQDFSVKKENEQVSWQTIESSKRSRSQA